VAIGPVVLRNGVDVEAPLDAAAAFVDAYGSWDAAGGAAPSAFREADLRHANRGGARMSATEIAAILERRPRIERALRAIPPTASLGATRSMPWQALGQLFEGFADIRGVGFAKMTKALHPKRPALIPILDSVVQAYLRDDDLGAEAPFGARALGLVRGYKRDVDRNRMVLRALRRELAERGHELSEVRILDILIWSAYAGGGS
jgi:Family of unknown function (DUF6308)